MLKLASVLPINCRLLTGALTDYVGRSYQNPARWGRLHTIRTVVAVVGTVVLWL